MDHRRLRARFTGITELSYSHRLAAVAYPTVLPQPQIQTNHRGTNQAATASLQIVVFLLEGQRYGLNLDVVERVLPALELTALPAAPQIVLGVFDLHGQLVPVADIRQRFQLPARELSPDQQLIVARTAVRRIAFMVDASTGVIDVPDTSVVGAGDILEGLPYVQGVARTADGLVLIHDLDTLLALDEVAALDAALPAPK